MCTKNGSYCEKEKKVSVCVCVGGGGGGGGGGGLRVDVNGKVKLCENSKENIFFF